VRESVEKAARDLLLADLSGEWFDDIVEGSLDPLALPHLARADHLVLVIDGEELQEPGARLVERQRAELLLRSLVESGVLASPSVLGMVVTKWDAVVGAGDTTLTFADALPGRVAESAGLPHSVPVRHVAARPKSDVLPLGHGLESLLGDWLAQPTTTIVHPVASAAHFPDAYSSFRATRVPSQV
jgi:hypothetical protein